MKSIPPYLEKLRIKLGHEWDFIFLLQVIRYLFEEVSNGDSKVAGLSLWIFPAFQAFGLIDTLTELELPLGEIDLFWDVSGRDGAFRIV